MADNNWRFPEPRTGTAGLEWFIPLFYLKLILGQLLPEEPYRLSTHSPHMGIQRIQPKPKPKTGGTHGS